MYSKIFFSETLYVLTIIISNLFFSDRTFREGNKQDEITKEGANFPFESITMLGR